MKILIVDDDKSMREVVSEMVESLGGEPVSATGAREALRRLQGEDYQYILLDMKMPDKDGLWFMKHARIPADTRIILMSGFVPGLILREMYRLGVCDYLEKPFDSQDLLDVLERQSRKKCHYNTLQEIAA